MRGVINKGVDERLQPITWERFEQVARARGLAVYESAGWMRLMRDREGAERKDRLGRRGDPWTVEDVR